MEIIKNILFDLLMIIGLAGIILTVLWWVIELLNRLFKLSKYIIMYHEYKRNENLYDLKNKIVVSKDGRISYSCIDGLDKQEDILNKAIKHIKDIKALQEKYSRQSTKDGAIP